MMYTYGSRTFTQFTYYDFPVPYADAQKCLIYAYYKTSLSGDSWYSVPGLMDAAYYETYSWIYSNGTSTRIRIVLRKASDRTAYTTAETWTAFKIIVVPIPAENITELASAGGSSSKGSAPDYSNYAEVAEYYGLPTE